MELHDHIFFCTWTIQRVNINPNTQRVQLRHWWQHVVQTPNFNERSRPILWIGSIFNGINIGTWNFDFPTSTEKWLWRSSSVASCLVLFGMFAVQEHVRNRSIAVLLLSFVGSTAYTAARGYLIVEALASLRSMSSQVYQSPNWVNMLP